MFIKSTQETPSGMNILSDKSNLTNVRVCSGTTLIWRRVLLRERCTKKGKQN